MSNTLYIDPTGQPTFGIGICARCSRKFPLAELSQDPNYPGLMVCKDDKDDYDPYRLAPRAPDQIILPFTRPDTPIPTRPDGLITEGDTFFITTEDGSKFITTKDVE